MGRIGERFAIRLPISIAKRKLRITGNSKFVLRWEIDNAAAVDAVGKAKSKVFNEGGFRWTAEVERVARPPKFMLRCGVDHSLLWKCEANVKFRLYLSNGSFIEKNENFFFDGNDEHNSFALWSFFTRQRYVVNNTVTLEFRIHIISAEGGKPIAELAAKFSTPNSRSDVVLKIGDKKLHVSKEYLAVQSPFFENLFFGNFAEKGKDEVELKDLVYEEFIDLLNVLYLENVEITDRTVLHIFKLADQFQIERVREMAKKCLIKSTGIDAVQKLIMADKYNLVDLRDQCLNSFLDAVEMNEKLKSSPSASNFSDGMKATIYDRYLKLQSMSSQTDDYSLNEDFDISNEIKGEPFDEFADIKKEDLIFKSTNDLKDEPVEIEEGEFVKLEEPIALSATDDQRMEIKVDIKKEEQQCALPIVDVFCPSSGASRPLLINLDEGICSKAVEQAAPPDPPVMNATKATTEDASVEVTRDDAATELDYSSGQVALSKTINNLSDKVARSCSICEMKTAEVELWIKHTQASWCTICKDFMPECVKEEDHVVQRHRNHSLITGRRTTYSRLDNCSQSRLKLVSAVPQVPKDPPSFKLPKRCTFCDSAHMMGDEMENHVRFVHPVEFSRSLRKCTFCNSVLAEGAAMENHVQSMHHDECNKLLQWKRARPKSCDKAQKRTRQLLDGRISPKDKTIQCKLTGADINLSGLTVKCDLCGILTFGQPYYVSPIDSGMAKLFFDVLIELTPKQREAADDFINKKWRMRVCGEHTNAMRELSNGPNKRGDDGVQVKKSLFDKSVVIENSTRDELEP